MRKTRIKGHRVVLHDDIDSMPVARFRLFNKYLLMDAGIGSDLDAFDARIARAVAMCRTGRPEEAEQELMNLRQTVRMILSCVSPREMAFATLVVSVDGRRCDDLSDEGLKSVMELLSDASRKDVASETGASKKKIDMELRLYFPGTFDTSDTKAWHDALRRWTSLVLEDVANGTDTHAQETGMIGQRLIAWDRPMRFDGPDGLEVRNDREFEDMCVCLAKELNVNPKRMTVMEFYNAYEYILRQSRKMARGIKGRRNGRK